MVAWLAKVERAFFGGKEGRCRGQSRRLGRGQEVFAGSDRQLQDHQRHPEHLRLLDRPICQLIAMLISATLARGRSTTENAVPRCDTI
jgi:hypothetical protein